MEIVLQILSIALVLFGLIGLITMCAIFAAIIMIIDGGEIRIGYDEDNDKIINNENEEEK